MNSSDSIVIRAAFLEDIPELGLLFDDYREFYSERRAPDESVAFVHRLVSDARTSFFVAAAPATGDLIGFVHLIPSFNTLAMRPILYLEDLFVRLSARRTGVASALMTYAEEFARRNGAERLTLATAHDNLAAQALYRRLGYVREEHFEYFHRLLSSPD